MIKIDGRAKHKGYTERGGNDDDEICLEVFCRDEVDMNIKVRKRKSVVIPLPKKKRVPPGVVYLFDMR